MHSQDESKETWFGGRAVALRYVFAGAFILALIWLQMLAVRDGYSRYYSDDFRNAKDLSAAESAVRYNPVDPQAYYARAHALRTLGKIKEAIRDYERATIYAPHNYFLWLEFGYAKLVDSNPEEALLAFRRSADIAPYYAQPRRYLGITLLTSQREEAFREFRRAINTDASLLGEVLKSAWEAYQGDAQSVIAAVMPQSEPAQVETAEFLIHHGAIEAAVEFIRSEARLSDEGKQQLLQLLVREKKFRESRALWETLDSVRELYGNEIGTGKLIDGGFEKIDPVESSAFGWQFAKKIPGLRISLDERRSHGGRYNVRLDFKGSESLDSIISQLIRVEPQTSYELSFYYRLSDLVTGGPPVVRVLDAYSGQLLQSAEVELTQKSEEWKSVTVTFQANASVDFVILSLQRKGCGGSCPIFGYLWLDDFSLKTANVNREL